MNRILPYTLLLAWLFQSCTGTRRFGTTIERDENNICQTNMVLQIGIQGTDADVTAVRTSLESCFEEECFTPCPDDSTKGCINKVKIVVKKWGDIKDEEQVGFHYVQMINDDGFPSTAYLGKPNVSTPEESCTWRRNAFGNTYCHEVLHLCGLNDRYCSRIYDPVLDSVITEVTCDPPPDPGGNCCLPAPGQRRCSTHCPGYENDIMGNSWNPLTCVNIKDVLTRAGFGDCPEACCKSGKTFTRPPDKYYIMTGLLYFGEKENKFGTLGIGAGYTHPIGGKGFGITIEAGGYIKTEKEEDVKQKNQLIRIGAGINYTIPPKGPVSFNTHILGGVLLHTRKQILPSETYTDKASAICINAGASLDLKAGSTISVRAVQVDIMPSFFGEKVQTNFRVSTGVVINLGPPAPR
jgi:hypothetical protein